MRNKQLKKFLFMFVLGLSLLFSFSSAEIMPNELYTQGTITAVNGSYNNSSIFIGNYTVRDVKNILYGYANGDELYTDSYNEIISLLENDGYVIQAWKFYQSDSYQIILYYWLDNVLDMGIYVYHDSSGVAFFDSYFLNSGTETVKIQSIRSGNTANNGFNILADSDVHKAYALNGYLNYELIYSPLDVKLLEFSTDYVVWDGESYFYKAESEPDFKGITDNQKVTIINSIINSTDFSTVPQKYRNQFFIVHNTWTNRYKVYFYPEQYYLKGRIFEEGSTADVDYKSYKIIAFEGSNFLWDLWQSINPFDYYVFSGYFNEDESFTSYFYEYVDSHKLNQHYFNYVDEPIVYTSRDIGFVIYNFETGEYDEDSINSIGSTILKDDEGNEIIIDIPVDNSTVSNTPWNKFLSLVQSIPEKIVSSFNNFTGLTKVITIITPLGSAIVIILGVLLSSASLLSRAVAFVYTLPTIPASDALFLADVDATTKGISFVGSKWGVRFLEGLNMVKNFSWNGLNLWTLFTSFIVAIFAIHCIKLVRKHYHY